MIALPTAGQAADPAAKAAAGVDPAEQAFFEAVQALCGQAFAGEVQVDVPAEANNPFASQPIRMHVRECSAEAVRIPLHVGEDRSRTWVLSRTGNGLRLKHDHRHADGSPDGLTQYGGDAAAGGSAGEQRFPADAESIALFQREGRSASVHNTWRMAITPGEHFVYELSRPDGRRFEVRFDLTRPVEAPPAPWGAVSP